MTPEEKAQPQVHTQASRLAMFVERSHPYCDMIAEPGQLVRRCRITLSGERSTYTLMTLDLVTSVKTPQTVAQQDSFTLSEDPKMNTGYKHKTKVRSEDFIVNLLCSRF